MEELVSSHWISSTFLFCQLLFMILALAHWLACFWYFFGNAESLHHEQTWVSVLRQKLADEGSDTAMYVTALYWTITTMTTVGYGDVVPESRQEKIFAIGTMMLSSWSFAYVLGSISGLISQSAEREAVLRAQTRGVNRFLRKYEIGKSLQFRVRRFLQYRLDEQRDQNYDERELLELLSSSLRMEISDFINGAILRVVPVFAEWEAMVISNLSRHLRTGSCSPGDVIVTQGEVTTELYFVQTGKVDIVYNTSSIRILGRREYFGEIGFFLKQPRCSSAKAVLFVELLSLKRNELMKIVEIYPEVKQLLEDTVFSKTENVLSSIGVICYHCEGLGHVACGCPSIFGFEERRQRLINRHRPQTKYISLVGESPAHIHRNPYRHVRAKPNIHNVVGIPNCTPERIFPNTPRLRMLMETYSSELESLPRKRDVDIRAVKSLANMEEDWSRRRAKQFSLLFENEAAAEVEPQQRLRTLSFRRTLLRSFRKDPVLDLVCEDSTKQPADDSARSCHRFLAKEPLFPERLVRLPSSFMT